MTAKKLQHWNREDKSNRIKLENHFYVVEIPYGAVLGTVFCNLIKGHVIWITVIPMAFLFYLMIHEDKSNGKEYLEQKPLGH